MHPVLFELGSLPIRSYGVAMALAFLVGILVARGRARRAGLNAELIVDLTFFVIIFSVLGARGAYVLGRWDWFSTHASHIPRIWDGGLVLYGGLVTGTITGLVFFRSRGVDPWLGADIVTPPLALGVAIGRIGCFLNGCCFGGPCDLPWAVTFPSGSYADRALGGVAVHPTQLYASLAAFGFFLILLMVDRKKPFNGFLLWLFVIMLAVYRFLVDPIRHYESVSYLARAGGLALTKNQVAGIALVAISLVFMVYLSRRRSVPRTGS